MSRRSLLDIADALRVPPSWLLHGEGEFSPEWVTPPELGPTGRGTTIARGPVMPLPRGLAADQASPPAPTQIDARILAQVLQLVDMIARDEPYETRARRIARAYDEATLPEDRLPRLPPHPSSEPPE